MDTGLESIFALHLTQELLDLCFVSIILFDRVYSMFQFSLYIFVSDFPLLQMSFMSMNAFDAWDLFTGIAFFFV